MQFFEGGPVITDRLVIVDNGREVRVAVMTPVAIVNTGVIAEDPQTLNPADVGLIVTRDARGSSEGAYRPRRSRRASRTFRPGVRNADTPSSS